MLQQTRVEVVVPYYERFVARFPDLGTLAAAPLEEVLAHWSGLGYYRRARGLHAAARELAAAGRGLPSSPAELARLPGIGAYTAAAVASIAFGVAEPVLDGNVERLAARLLALPDEPRTAAARRRSRELAAGLLDPEHAGDSNQALMELGATVCTPRRPRCAACPLRAAGDGWAGCAAAASGDPEAVPPPRRRRPSERHHRLVAIVERAGRLLLFRRPDADPLLAGTWELPWVDSPPAAGAGAGAAAAALGARYGGRWRLGATLGRARHGITFRDLELTAVTARLEDGDALAEGGPEAAWHTRGELVRLPLSSMVGKVLALADPAVSPPRAGRRR
jgi:A/G-specific adenine glycosylase